MTRKGGLGKGLGAMIPTSGDFDPGMTGESREQGHLAPGSASVLQIPVEAIVSNPHQPRTSFDPEELEELAASIREHGVIQPLIVTRSAADQYTLIAGERRLRAARLAGLLSVPGILREASDIEMVELALIENVQRADLSPLETAEAYRELNTTFGLTHEQIAERVGKSRSAVTNTLRLLELPADVQQALANGEISEGHGRALLGLPNSQAQSAALKTILDNGLTVRQAEDLVNKYKGYKPPAEHKALPPELSAIEDRLRSGLGAKVTLRPGRKGGSLTIHYFSDEELDAIIERILTR